MYVVLGTLGGGLLACLMGIGLVTNNVVIPGTVLIGVGVSLLIAFIWILRDERGKEEAITGFSEFRRR